ncbi:DUF4942 domain-containing protein [Klebsiella oxytoca]|uniref:class I SAM-dependent methyltransferase n=1 Tax=Klebsiella oxytoca TaxID=571 RepID=UPI001CCB748D|nr:class I SAM-dependent methyltransferase [Klebsiella oxytoca]MBZ7262460.1 DUF4942 domain-containing protein [Klebsiella oxytoca]
MTTTAEVFNTEEFFAPAPSDLVDNLMGRYNADKQRIESLALLISDTNNQTAVEYFLRGNRTHTSYIPPVSNIFAREGAVANLNAMYWQKALLLTDVLDFMPAKRRDEWNEQIREMKTPEFEEDTVRATLIDMLNSRAKFFGERVDGIFRALSGEHVTNRPEGFSKRMIFYVGYAKEHISDLRQVIAKFMGRDEPTWWDTNRMLEEADRKTGQWLGIDGGSMRIRTYLKGTAHFEVHPDMAWRLNCVLASMYPNAIPPQFRSKPKKAPKDFVIMEHPLPFAVLRCIAEMNAVNTRTRRSDYSGQIIQPVTSNPYSREFSYSSDNTVRVEARQVLESIGATRFKLKSHEWFEFEYDPREVLAHIITSGCIPDNKSHQFYPTPPKLAEHCVSLACIESHHKCLEPSAGHGGLADFMPSDQTICVEISPLKCQVLDSKGFRVYEADFLKWAANGGCFDRIVMNPPFSEGRAQVHLEAAASLTKSGSRIVAILPAGMKNKQVLNAEWNCTWSEVYSGEFTGTNVSVVILLAERC